MKRFIPISEYCRRSAWAISPARIRAWCREGYRGRRPPFLMIGGRYFLDAELFEGWLFGKGESHRRRESAAAKIREIIRREDRRTREGF